MNNEKGVSCPITGEQRDNSIVRTTASLVFFTTIVGLVTGVNGLRGISTAIFALLAADFLVRAFLKPRYSILAGLGKIIKNLLRLETRLEDVGPKIFAARIGFILSLIIALLTGFGALIPAIVLSIVLLICSGLEAFLGFCVGCFMYSLLPESLKKLLTR